MLTKMCVDILPRYAHHGECAMWEDGTYEINAQTLHLQAIRFIHKTLQTPRMER